MARTQSKGGGLWDLWDRSVFGRGRRAGTTTGHGTVKGKKTPSNRRVKLPPELRMPRGCPCCSREFRNMF